MIFNDNVPLEFVQLKMNNQELEEIDELNLSLEEEDSCKDDLLHTNLSKISKDQILELIPNSPENTSIPFKGFILPQEIQQPSYQNSYLKDSNLNIQESPQNAR